MNILSLVVGIVAFLGALIGFTPLLGSLNWFVLPVAFIGLVLGLIAKENSGRNVNLVVIAIAVVRLSLGGGIL